MPVSPRNDFRPGSFPMVGCLVDVFSRPLSSGEYVEIPGFVGYGATIRGLNADLDQSFTMQFVGPKGMMPSLADSSWDVAPVIAWVARALALSSRRSEVFASLGQGVPVFPALTALRVEGVSSFFSMSWPSGVEVDVLAAPAEAQWSAMVLSNRLPEPQAQALPIRL